MKANIIYWSGTGNTQKMAELIAKGFTDAGGEAMLKEVSDAFINDVENCDVLVLGCSSMGDEVLEEDSFEPYIVSIQGSVYGKKMALFGSYGWGDGQWMRDFTERMQAAGAELVVESLIVNEYPEGSDVDLCRSFLKELAK